MFSHVFSSAFLTNVPAQLVIKTLLIRECREFDVYMYIHIYTFIYQYTYVYIYIYLSIYIYIHMYVSSVLSFYL